MNKKLMKGFTLIELMLVLSIIAVISIVSFYTYFKIKERQEIEKINVAYSLIRGEVINLDKISNSLSANDINSYLYHNLKSNTVKISENGSIIIGNLIGQIYSGEMNGSKREIIYMHINGSKLSSNICIGVLNYVQSQNGIGVSLLTSSDPTLRKRSVSEITDYCSDSSMFYQMQLPITYK